MNSEVVGVVCELVAVEVDLLQEGALEEVGVVVFHQTEMGEEEDTEVVGGVMAFHQEGEGVYQEPSPEMILLLERQHLCLEIMRAEKADHKQVEERDLMTALTEAHHHPGQEIHIPPHQEIQAD